MQCTQRLGRSITLIGFSALKKLPGRKVYSSHMQLGCPKVTATNGVVHLTVSDDLGGVSSILKWLGFVTPRGGGPLPICKPLDSQFANPWTPAETRGSGRSKGPFREKHAKVVVSRAKAEEENVFFEGVPGRGQNSSCGNGEETDGGIQRRRWRPKQRRLKENANSFFRSAGNPGNPTRKANYHL
ncbi:uncharacterized protein J3R85_003993 [Psidium guajava]|nr:uncharacterized protein J3R85_003993 [Psidium guajava]